MASGVPGFIKLSEVCYPGSEPLHIRLGEQGLSKFRGVHQRRGLGCGSAALPSVSRIARAQAYPSRPVHLIVPFAAGGGTDILARLIGQWLSERLGQQFVIDNRPGGGSNIGTEAVVCPGRRLHAARGQ